MKVSREVASGKLVIQNCVSWKLYERLSDNTIFMVIPSLLSSTRQVIYIRGSSMGMGYDNLSSVANNECIEYNGRLILQND